MSTSNQPSGRAAPVNIGQSNLLDFPHDYLAVYLLAIGLVCVHARKKGEKIIINRSIIFKQIFKVRKQWYKYSYHKIP